MEILEAGTPGPRGANDTDYHRPAYHTGSIAHRVSEAVKLKQNGDLRMAMKMINSALDVDPTCVEALVVRGAALVSQEMYEPAIKDFRRALDIDPLAPNARNYLDRTEAKLAELKREKESALLGEYVMPANFDPKSATAFDSMPKRRPGPTSTASHLMQLVYSPPPQPEGPSLPNPKSKKKKKKKDGKKDKDRKKRRRRESPSVTSSSTDSDRSRAGSDASRSRRRRARLVSPVPQRGR
ncbi:hypothetical protein BDK51DRAFT_34822 [Blyttiomyces helicus]|uniref:Uncharacterized protein n=1 Tax=Blyttiomyces helicus TaxID=388810 RepID=A0A4P9WBS3_9FUNG|nr:hypothetical protein BDK51DRAFT_34822 [Blyttiomyces helicus]|eukprot:RKO89722.1 hypothetical protein BDK51DRAFT_34822 [Blyttiomyces helicus]